LVERGIAIRHVDLFDAASARTALAAVRPEVVIHLGWLGVSGHSETDASTLSGVAAGLHVLRACHDAGCARVVCAASGAAYARHAPAQDRARTEGTLYPASRNALQQLAHAYLDDSPTRLAWARTFFPYGPGEPAETYVGAAARVLATGGTFTVREPRRHLDFVYVDDVAGALATLAEAPAAVGSYDVGTGEAMPLLEVAHTVARAAGAVPTRVIEAPADAPADDVRADAAPLRALGWLPEISLHEGATRMLAALGPAGRSGPAIA
jgi:nucleoside-diphosphate-sugar epimerase